MFVLPFDIRSYVYFCDSVCYGNKTLNTRTLQPIYVCSWMKLHRIDWSYKGYFRYFHFILIRDVTYATVICLYIICWLYNWHIVIEQVLYTVYFTHIWIKNREKKNNDEREVVLANAVTMKIDGWQHKLLLFVQLAEINKYKKDQHFDWVHRLLDWIHMRIEITYRSKWMSFNWQCGNRCNCLKHWFGYLPLIS